MAIVGIFPMFRHALILVGAPTESGGYEDGDASQNISAGFLKWGYPQLSSI